MQRLKKHKSLFDAEPKLIREWHPSANGNLTPQSVTMNYSKRIWWICGAGHEWQATIKCRLKLKGCLICQKEKTPDDLIPALSAEVPSKNGRESFAFIQIPNAALLTDSRYTGRNFRRNIRYKVKGLAVIEIPESGHWLYAEMTNISRRGLGFETEAHIRPGTAIKVKLNRLLVSSNKESYKSCNSIVKWSKKIDIDEDESISNYRIGAEIINHKLREYALDAPHSRDLRIPL